MLDGSVLHSVDLTFDLLYRDNSGGDTALVSWSHHFDPKPGADFTATTYAVDGNGIAGPAFTQGDQLIFRYSAQHATSTTCWTPNGDGASGGGEIPNITFPK